MKSGDSEPLESTLKSNRSADGQSLKKRESVVIPLNNSKEENKKNEIISNNDQQEDIINEERKREELGVILEEQSENSTVAAFKNNRNKVLTQKSSNTSQKEFGKSYTKQMSNVKLGFLAPGNSILNDPTKRLSNTGGNTMEDQTDMKDLFNSLNKLSVSDKDIKEISEEFSQATDSGVLYPQNISTSSALSKYNKHLNYGGKNSRQ